MQLKVLRTFFRYMGAVWPALAGRAAVRVFYKPRRLPAPNWEKAAAANSTSVPLRWKGGELAARVWGEGPTVLLVHGWEGRSTQLAKFALALVDDGYRVVTFDGPAHGAARQERTTLVEFADVVASAVEQFGPVDALVGHSFGAAAACIALQNGAQAGRLVLISCPFSIRNVVSRFAQFLSLPSAAHEKMYPIMDRLHGCTEQALSFSSIGPALSLPTLMVHDTDDKYVPFSDGQAVAQRIRGARLVKTSGLGHLRILQDASVVRLVADFVGLARREAECGAAVPSGAAQRSRAAG